MSKHLPSGSGIDSGTKIDLENSRPNKIVLDVEYHHMDDNGSYNGWTTHKVIVTPDLFSGISLKVTGKNRNDIKDYLHDVYYHALLGSALAKT